MQADGPRNWSTNESGREVTMGVINISNLKGKESIDVAIGSKG